MTTLWDFPASQAAAVRPAAQSKDSVQSFSPGSQSSGRARRASGFSTPHVISCSVSAPGDWS